MLLQILNEAWAALRRNRTRSALTMLGIVWGIATVTLLIAYGGSFRKILVSGFDAFGKGAVICWPQQTSEQPGGKRRVLYDEAVANHYFPPTSGLLLTGSKPIDFTNPAPTRGGRASSTATPTSVSRASSSIMPRTSCPAPGAIATSWKFADGSDERTMHYGYTLLYHQIYAETLPASRRVPAVPRRPLGRSTTVSVMWPAIWTRPSPHGGDPHARRRDPVRRRRRPARDGHQGMGFGPSGFPFFGADTGG